MGRSCSQNGRGEGWSAFKILTGRPTGKRLLGKPRHRWEDNIRMDLKEIDINSRNWDWRALVNATVSFRVA